MTKAPRTRPPKDKSNSVPQRAGMQLISRTAAVLRALEGRPTGLTLGQIAKSASLPRPTIQRIVNALCAEQLVVIDPLRGGVCLGPMSTRLSASIRIDLVSLARPHLERLSWQTEETAAMTVLQDGKVVVIALVAPSTQEIRLTSSVGAIWALHSTADGKAMMAGLPEPALRNMLVEPLQRRTPNTVTNVSRLIKEIKDIELTNIALDREGTTEGISAIATNLIDATGTRHAISLLAPASRFDTHLDRFRKALLDVRGRILDAAGLPK